jgi:hypothetical protein
MDKAEFVAVAPVYYALAIVAVLQKRPYPVPEFKIRSEFPDNDDSNPDVGGTLLDRHLLWERGVAWLVTRNMITVRYDPFGPPILSQTPKFTEIWDELVKDDSLPFSAYDAAGKSDDWLIPALHALDNTFANLEVRAEDFENPDAEWSPIKIDRGDPVVEKAISSLERVIEEVRADNGYTATHPQERDFVLEGLQGTLKKLESETISSGYVRVAIERLGTLTRRFAGTLKEGVIAAAKAALIEFAKKQFGDLLNYVWKWPF